MQILVTIEKLLILHRVAFMPLEISKSTSDIENINLLSNPNVDSKIRVAYSQKTSRIIQE